jgi:hypothetical protein
VETPFQRDFENRANLSICLLADGPRRARFSMTSTALKQVCPDLLRIVRQNLTSVNPFRSANRHEFSVAAGIPPLPCSCLGQ